MTPTRMTPERIAQMDALLDQGLEAASAKADALRGGAQAPDLAGALAGRLQEAHRILKDIPVATLTMLVKDYITQRGLRGDSEALFRALVKDVDFLEYVAAHQSKTTTEPADALKAGATAALLDAMKE